MLYSKKLKKKILDPSDNSFSINICCNQQHEVEILHNTLSNLLNKHSNIKTHDIIVTSFSIDDYISHIKSVFQLKNKNTIPFSISKKYSKKTEVMIFVFKKMLNLSISRFSNQEILDLLDIPEIAKNFDISEDEIDILYYWIEKINTRWAVNQQHQRNLSLPKINQNTWFYSIEKLMLSFSMNHKKHIWNNITTSAFIDNSRSKLIGKLAEFINILNKWRKKLLRSQNLSYWDKMPKLLIHDIFYTNQTTQQSFEIIQKVWNNMIYDSLLSNYTKKVPISILRKNFIYNINRVKNEQLHPGGINFCHPSMICHIPFKVICIIGADNNQISFKKEILNHINLLKQKPLIGDVNLYEQHAYLFSQMFSCAKQYFYISYINFSIEKNTKQYPLIFVDQLLHYISHNFCFIGDENLNIQDNTKKIFKHFQKKHNLFLFSKIKNVSFSNIYHINKIKNKKFFNKNLYIKNASKIFFSKKIDLKNLIKFWQHPIRYFCNIAHNIKIYPQKKPIITTEPFSVNSFDRFKINSEFLKKIIKNQNIQSLFKYYTLSGILPYGYFGTTFLEQQIQKMYDIAKLVNFYKKESQIEKYNLKINDFKLYGTLSEIQNTGLLRWTARKINYSDRISLWLEHLVYSILGNTGESKIIGYDKQIWSFVSIPSNIANNYLLKYIEGYMYGLKTPIFLTQSGAHWIDKIYDKKNHRIHYEYDIKKRGYNSFLKKWKGNSFYSGEQEEGYIKKIISKTNKKNIKKIYATSKKWLLPILQYRKYK